MISKDKRREAQKRVSKKEQPVSKEDLKLAQQVLEDKKKG